MKKYESFQVTWVLLAMGPMMILIYYLYLTKAGDNPLPFEAMLAVECIFLLIVLLFYGLKITVTNEQIELKFGIGWIRKRIQIADIESVTVVRNQWYYGLGIRFIPHGMLYSAHGLGAVELKFRNKKRILRIGSPERERLQMEIEARMSTLV